MATWEEMQAEVAKQQAQKAAVESARARIEARRTYGQASANQTAIRRLEMLRDLGDIRPNELAELARLKQGEAADSYAIEQTEATYRGALQGATFRQSDEIGGMFGGQEYRDQIRSKNKAAQAAFPAEYATGEMAGAVGSSIGLSRLTAPLGAAASLPGVMARGAGLGAAEGALWGAGTGEGIEDKARQAGLYGAAGGAIGGAAPLGVAGLATAGRAVGNVASAPVNAALGRASNSSARQAIAKLLQKSGVGADDATRAVRSAAADGQPEFRLMDALGVPGQRKASGIVRAGGPGADEIAGFLQQRQADAGDRMTGLIDDAFGMQGQTRKEAEAMVRKNRQAVADRLYFSAADDAAPVEVGEAVGILDDTITKMSNSGIEPPAVVKEYQKLRGQLAGVDPDGNPTTLSDYRSVLSLWREVRDNVEKAYKAGDGALGEALKPVRDSLQRSLEGASDLYRSATGLYREGSRVIDAFDTGAKAAKGSGRAADSVRTFEGLTDQQKRAARIGYGDEIAASVERNKATGANVAREFGSTKRRTEAGAMALQPDRFARQVEREGTMHGTYDRALQGSRTADNQADLAELAAAGPLTRAAMNAANFQFGNAARDLGAAVGPYLTNNTEATRALIARMLLSADPESALAKVAREQARGSATRRIAEALVRGTTREAQAY